MGKINGCLKCLFIFFNVLYAILGVVLIVGLFKVSGVNQQMAAMGSPSIGWLWVFSIGILCISCLGIYAAGAEKALALKIFAGFMVAGMIIMLIFGILVVVSRDKLRQAFDSATTEVVEHYMENEDMRQMIEALQLSGRCCGVVSAADWGEDIPQSCECTPSYGSYAFGSSECKSRPTGCSGYIFGWANLFFQIAMAFFFGFAVTAVLGLLVSLLMIRQIQRYDGAGGSSIAMKGY
ncbi:tetraspanin-8-like [Xyrichtys novacula]|uniref:Tetraspanin n=1 Tax=Xyrichtys novacula TaxID=13765 RepID=A0AAV1F0Y8_XYRNO|nr:tetraspanin-8-like [Xyrichtys novacula]